MDSSKLLNELRDFYKLHDYGSEGKLSNEEIDRYHVHMLEAGLLHYELDGFGHLLGYIEAWRVTPEQIGRIMFCEKFDVYAEDITRGKICYVANITIRPDQRGSDLLKILKGRCIQKNFSASHFCGYAGHSRAKSFKIFTKKDYWAYLERKVIENVIQQG
jgi:hypothetical protein